MNADNSAPGCLTLSYAPTPGGGGGEELMGLLSGQGSLSDWLKRLRYLENYLDCGEDVSGPKHLSWEYSVSVWTVCTVSPVREQDLEICVSNVRGEGTAAPSPACGSPRAGDRRSSRPAGSRRRSGAPETAPPK